MASIAAADLAGRYIRPGRDASTRAPRFFPVYFSYRGDFEYLRLSIQSICDHARDLVGAIYVYEDRAQPLTSEQRQLLADGCPQQVVFRQTRAPMAWGGITLLHNELSAFLDLAAELSADDYIVKVDSDVLFTAGWLFPAASSSSRDLIGQPVASLATHTRRAVPDVQGGCYFLRAGAVGQLRGKSLLAAARQVVRTTSYDLWRVPEDRTMSQWAHDAGLTVMMIDFYLLDLGRLRSSAFDTDAEIESCLEQHGAFAVIHFERCKDKMHSCYRWLLAHPR